MGEGVSMTNEIPIGILIRTMICIHDKGKLLAELAGCDELRRVSVELAVKIARVLSKRMAVK